MVAAVRPAPLRTGVSTAATWVKRPAVADPEFTVLAGGLGAILQVKFPDRSAVYTTLGSAVGLSQHVCLAAVVSGGDPKSAGRGPTKLCSGCPLCRPPPQVTTSVVTEGGPLNALMRRLSGATFFLQKFATAEVPGDVLLSPKHLGDIATIRMDGTSEYFIARNAYLASTPHLSLAPRVSRLGVGLDANFFHIKVSGKGVLAVTTYGGLLRLALAPGEVYYVHSKYAAAARRHAAAAVLGLTRSRLPGGPCLCSSGTSWHGTRPWSPCRPNWTPPAAS